jgi:hypothetical protein
MATARPVLLAFAAAASNDVPPACVAALGALAVVTAAEAPFAESIGLVSASIEPTATRAPILRSRARRRHPRFSGPGGLVSSTFITAPRFVVCSVGIAHSDPAAS